MSDLGTGYSYLQQSDDTTHTCPDFTAIEWSYDNAGESVVADGSEVKVNAYLAGMGIFVT